MKLIIIILIGSILTISCTKQMPETQAPTTDTAKAPVQHAAVERILSSPSVTIDSVKYKPVYAGSNMSLEFSVYLSNVVNVSNIQLIRENSGTQFKVNSPSNGLTKLYDRTINGYPTAARNIFYHFETTMGDGSILTSDKFQVY